MQNRIFMYINFLIAVANAPFAIEGRVSMMAMVLGICGGLVCMAEYIKESKNG